MIEIKINATEIANIVYENRNKIGSTDWGLYVDESGTLDLRHDTHDLWGWYEISDMYSWWIGEDEFEDWDSEEYGNWIKSDGLDLGMIEDAINNNLLYEYEKIHLAWV